MRLMGEPAHSPGLDLRQADIITTIVFERCQSARSIKRRVGRCFSLKTANTKFTAESRCIWNPLAGHPQGTAESAKCRYQRPRQAMGNDVAPTRKSLTAATDHRDREVTVGMMAVQAQVSTYGKGQPIQSPLAAERRVERKPRRSNDSQTPIQTGAARPEVGAVIPS
jgi:hypothetical protein